jgi:hypothetical protein
MSYSVNDVPAGYSLSPGDCFNNRRRGREGRRSEGEEWLDEGCHNKMVGGGDR